jgi:hypothetical protein
VDFIATLGKRKLTSLQHSTRNQNWRILRHAGGEVRCNSPWNIQAFVNVRLNTTDIHRTCRLTRILLLLTDRNKRISHSHLSVPISIIIRLNKSAQVTPTHGHTKRQDYNNLRYCRPHTAHKTLLRYPDREGQGGRVTYYAWERHTVFWSKTLKEKEYLEDPDVDRALKWTFKNNMGGFELDASCFRQTPVAGSCEHSN